MYYPFLRDRQFELIALRELVSAGAIENTVIPIWEPLKEPHNNLNLAYEVFRERDFSSYLILNPSYGEMAGDGLHYVEYLATLQEGIYLPAFRYRSNGDYIRQCIEDNELQKCLIICQNDVNAEDPDFTRIAELDQVVAFNVEDPGRNRTLSRYIRGLDKNFIRLDDLFERQLRNSDFLPIAEHQFSEEHLHFEDEHFK